MEVHLLDLLLILHLTSIVSFVQVLYPLLFLLLDPQEVLGEQVELVFFSLCNLLSCLLSPLYVHYVHLRYLNQFLLL